MITQPAAPSRARQAQVPAVVIGDSIIWYGSESGTLSGAPYQALTTRNIFDLFNGMLGNPLKVMNRAGVSGNRIDQMVDRFDTDVRPFKPGVVFLEGISNNLDQGYSAAQSWPSIVKMYQLCASIGAPLVFLGTAAMRRTNASTPVSPIDGVQYNESAEFAALEAFSREAAATYPGFIYCPMAVAARDYSLSAQEMSFGTPVANVTVDNTHPVFWGTYLYARYMADTLGPMFAVAVKRLPTLNGYGTAGDQSLLLQNSLLGSKTAVSAPNSGFAPANVNITSSGSIRALLCDVVPRTDGGAGQKMVIPYSASAAAGDYLNIGGSGNYTKAIGLLAFIMAGIKVTQTAGQVLNIIGNLQLQNSSNTVLAQTFFGRPHSAYPAEVLNVPAGQTFDLGFPSTVPYVVPAGTAKWLMSLRVYTTPGATGTIEIVDFDSRADDVSAFVASFLK